MKIYTKTGDKGETGFIGGRISKGSDRIELIGTLDELNASLGIVIAQFKSSSKPEARSSELTAQSSELTAQSSELTAQSSELFNIQSSIFSIGAIIAGGKSKQDFKELTKQLEDYIDEMEKDLTPLQNFILPGGSLIASQIHLARTVCRRVERAFTRYNSQPETRSSELAAYLNRLSDYLFVLARFVNLKLGEEDVIWTE